MSPESFRVCGTLVFAQTGLIRLLDVFCRETVLCGLLQWGINKVIPLLFLQWQLYTILHSLRLQSP